MNNKPLHILSTKQLDSRLLQLAGDGVELDCIPFIKTRTVSAAALAAAIDQVPLTDAAVIFTSAHAVTAVAAALTADPVWKIYCIETATLKKVRELFPRSEIIASAPTGAALVKRIIKKRPGHLFFFCGNLRLETIPDALRQNSISCNELVVYTTTLTPVRINRMYDGILFYSPSGVESFFSLNTITEGTTAVSIGPSTTTALKKYTSAIVEAATPDIGQMIRLVAAGDNWLR
ncbi:uroporphyrinogen-III synthase [Niabella beijingensis]|uniref:uroporphyrinogen-III synthase n=1 Tax=Niabella beijingensis TaxID=2872700 RepID=UPI001CBFA831|nr:uroporphyrinogen-III synthase [Niabella beijingensis]MBZ4189045.1 uroporphyrinogen-III synthase [Niabella beijingensis]